MARATQALKAAAARASTRPVCSRGAGRRAAARTGARSAWGGASVTATGSEQASLVDGAVGCVRAGDAGGARCLLRAAAWVVGIKGATEVEPAMLEALHGEVEAEPGAPFSEVRSRFNLLLGPDPHLRRRSPHPHQGIGHP